MKILLSDHERIVYENNVIKINIPDPNLFLAIQDYIEDIGGFLDIQLNSRLLQVRETYLLKLLYHICDTDEKEAIELAIKKQKEKNIPIQNIPENSKTKKEVFDYSIQNIAGVLSIVKDLAVALPYLWDIANNLLNII